MFFSFYISKFFLHLSTKVLKENKFFNKETITGLNYEIQQMSFPSMHLKLSTPCNSRILANHEKVERITFALNIFNIRKNFIVLILH